MRLILLGAPGSGKGTQAKELNQVYNIPAVCTGDLFREAQDKKTPLGREVQKYLQAGRLVPDSLVSSMMEEHLKSMNAFILDGYPRTIGQAHDLKNMLVRYLKEPLINGVIYLKVNKEALVNRITGRRVAKKSGGVYHLQFNPPKKPGFCDISGEPLVHREDDKKEIVETRIKEYFKETLPLIQYYKNQSLLKEIDGNRTLQEVNLSLKNLVDTL